MPDANHLGEAALELGDARALDQHPRLEHFEHSLLLRVADFGRGDGNAGRHSRRRHASQLTELTAGLPQPETTRKQVLRR